MHTIYIHYTYAAYADAYESVSRMLLKLPLSSLRRAFGGGDRTPFERRDLQLIAELFNETAGSSTACATRKILTNLDKLDVFLNSFIFKDSFSGRLPHNTVVCFSGDQCELYMLKI